MALEGKLDCIIRLETYLGQDVMMSSDLKELAKDNSDCHRCDYALDCQIDKFTGLDDMEDAIRETPTIRELPRVNYFQGMGIFNYFLKRRE